MNMLVFHEVLSSVDCHTCYKYVVPNDINYNIYRSDITYLPLWLV
jgi:hypothetical protein